MTSRCWQGASPEVEPREGAPLPERRCKGAERGMDVGDEAAREHVVEEDNRDGRICLELLCKVQAYALVVAVAGKVQHLDGE